MERPPPGMSKMQEMKWKKEQTKLSTRAVAASGPPAQPLGPPPGMTKMQQAKWKREQAKLASLAAAPAARKDSVSESSAATRIQARQRGRRDRRALQQRRRGGDGGGPPRSAGRAGQTAGRAGRSPQVREPAATSKRQAATDSSGKAAPDGFKLHVRGVGGRLENEEKLKQLFKQFGRVVQATVRHREDEAGNNTSWALVTMRREAGMRSALAATVMNPETKKALVVTEFSQKQADVSKGGMVQVQKQSRLREMAQKRSEQRKRRALLKVRCIIYLSGAKGLRSAAENGGIVRRESEAEAREGEGGVLERLAAKKGVSLPPPSLAAAGGEKGGVALTGKQRIQQRAQRKKNIRRAFTKLRAVFYFSGARGFRHMNESSAATRIQARQRGRRDRRALQQRRRSAGRAGLNPTTGRAAGRVNTASASPAGRTHSTRGQQRKDAAVKLQAAHRGRMARSQVRHKRLARTASPSLATPANLRLEPRARSTRSPMASGTSQSALPPASALSLAGGAVANRILDEQFSDSMQAAYSALPPVSNGDAGATSPVCSLCQANRAPAWVVM